ncbi:cell division protein [Rathayibacter toxicus]|uniref:Cell division protein n=1 Tax=Rathayibacter toxicus TaxID=145458 RepID=A0A2S5Y6P8_9MICO|nr:cell division protein [Rathayibacter toxicus]PPG46522.1 cell division protein [Rathayibacter toxicus]PPH23599.1 cell division protein [Rathayibacter toxicus]PPH57404.1 cell division protein [Rathayibacter toxicus]PPH59904.1 cell division protein [Rathayibacter toxicus]
MSIESSRNYSNRSARARIPRSLHDLVRRGSSAPEVCVKRPSGIPSAPRRPPLGTPNKARESEKHTEPIALAGMHESSISAGSMEAAASESGMADEQRKRRPASVISTHLASVLGSARLSGTQRRAIARATRERRRYERDEVRRFSRRGRGPRTLVLAAVGSILALAVVAGLAAYSPLMAVRAIEISGTARVDAAAVSASLGGQLGVPLALVDQAAVGRELSAYPLIESYSVRTRPPETLVVSVVERTPIGVLPVDGRYELVDAAGVVIQTAEAAQVGYPLLTTPSGDASGKGFRAAADVLRVLPSSFRGKVTAAKATTGDDVSLTLANGAAVIWGRADQSAVKAVVLEKLIAATTPATVASYDVSSPQDAVVTRR